MVLAVVIGLFILFVIIGSLVSESRMDGSGVVFWISLCIILAIGAAVAYWDSQVAELEKSKTTETAALRSQIQELEAKAIAAGVATRVPVKVVENTVFMFNADMVTEASGRERQLQQTPLPTNSHQQLEELNDHILDNRILCLDSTGRDGTYLLRGFPIAG